MTHGDLYVAPRRFRVLLALLTPGLAAGAGCIHQGPLRMRVPAHVAVPERCAILFFVDGLDGGVFDRMLDAGELPAIDRYLVKRGVRVRHAVTCIPSITYANTVTLLTGLYPGHHDVVSNKWFDRRTFIWRDYNLISTYQFVNDDFDAPTIHEVLHDRVTVNMQCGAYRGATRNIDNWAVSGVCWYFGWHQSVDQLIALDFEELPYIARATGRWPAFINAYMPGLDAEGHRFGADDPTYVRALRNIDRQVGRIGDALARAGLLDRTVLVLTSDHGHVPTPRDYTLDVAAWLRERFGWTIHQGRYDGGTLDSRHRHFANVQAVGTYGGNRWYGIDVPGDDGWANRPTFERCREILTSGEPALASLPAIRAAACRNGPDAVWLVGPGGEATVTRRVHDNRTQYRYDVASGDPLSVLDDAAPAARVAEGWHDSRAWLEATATARCPDAVAQIVDAFDSPRMPDIVLFAADDWDFAGTELGGHGSIEYGDMHVPMVWAGPGIAQGGSLHAARVADVAPTLIELVAGRERLESVERLDGVSLASQLRSASPSSKDPS